MTGKVKINGIIDRIEGGVAVIVNGEGDAVLNLPLSALPEGSGEGAIIEIRISAKKNREREAKKKVELMIDRLQKGQKPTF